MFFIEKDADGAKINYYKAVTGAIRIIPTGKSLAAPDHDYNAMLEDGFLATGQPDFSAIVESCRVIQDRLNKRCKHEDASVQSKRFRPTAYVIKVIRFGCWQVRRHCNAKASTSASR